MCGVQLGPAATGPVTTAFSYYIASEEYAAWRESSLYGGNMAPPLLDVFGIYVAPSREGFATGCTNLAVLPPNASVGAGQPVTTESLGVANADLFVNGSDAISGSGSWYARPADGSVLLRSADFILHPGGACW